MKKRRVLIISAVFPPEPLTSSRMNYDLAKALSKEYLVTVLRPVPSRPIGSNYEKGSIDETINHIRIVTLGSFTCPESRLLGRIKESIAFSKECIKFIKKCGEVFDFVYNDAWQFIGLFMIARYCNHNKIPYIVPIQDVYPESLLTHLKWPDFLQRVILKTLIPIDKYYQKNAVSVRTITPEMADYLSGTRQISRDRYLVVHNWQEAPKRLYEEPENCKTVFAYFGSVNEHANVELIIRSFIALNSKDAELWIYGSGNRLDACKRIAKMNYSSSVIFGEFTPENMYELQSKADVLVLALPSGNGTLALPSKLSSYLFSGKPVLASVDAGCSVDGIIRNNKCGKSVLPGDEKGLSEGYSYFIQIDTSTRKEMGQRGRDFAYKHLTKDLNLEIVVQAIKKTITQSYYGKERTDNSGDTSSGTEGVETCGFIL